MSFPRGLPDLEKSWLRKQIPRADTIDISNILTKKAMEDRENIKKRAYSLHEREEAYLKIIKDNDIWKIRKEAVKKIYDKRVRGIKQ